MTDYTPQEWVDKADSEGGLGKAILGYGLTEQHLVPGSDPELFTAIRRFRRAAAEPLAILERAASRYQA